MSDATNIAIARRISGRFAPHWRRSYVYHKLRTDPAYRAVADAVCIDPRDLLDVGCGLGLLGQYLRERDFSEPYLGIDIDAAKIACAADAAKTIAPALQFAATRLGDDVRTSGHVVLLDVLHYLTTSEQRQLLARSTGCVAPGALLIIRSVIREHGWRFRVTAWQEKFMRAIGWMRSPVRDYPSRRDIEDPIRAAGLEFETKPLWGNTPFNSFLIVAKRGEGGASP